MVNNLVKESVKKLKPYEVKEYKNVTKLDANENNHIGEKLNEKIAQEIMNSSINKYPDSDCTALRKQIGGALRIAPQQVIVGNGSDQIISLIIDAFVGAGDKVVTSTPTFGMYKITTEAAEGTTVEVPLGKNFEFDYYSLIKAVKKEEPKVVFLTNPNNPTGGIIPREQMIRIVENANSVVVVDEAYYEFYGESMVDLVNYYPNLLVLRTLSKGFGLAGARVGYGVGSKEIIRILNKVKPPYNVGSLSQVAAKVCLENTAMVTELIEDIIKEREKMMKQLKSLPNVEVYKSYGNFILFKLQDAKEIQQYLLEQGILVRYFGDTGPLADCIRVSIGTSRENALFTKSLQETLTMVEEIAV